MNAFRPSYFGFASATAEGKPGQTELDMILTGIPWSDELEMGWGVNAVTGEGAAEALLPLKFTSASTRRDDSFSQAIFTTEALSKTLSMAIAGQYSIQGSTIGASASFLDDVRMSSTEATLIAQVTSITKEYESAIDVQLKPEARALMESDPAKFRELYGDYFVQGRRLGSRMLVICKFSSRTSDRIRALSAQLSGSVPNVFQVEGSTALREMVSSSQVSMSISTLYLGLPANVPPSFPSSIDEVPKVLEWFTKHAVGSPLEARLAHYASINPAYSRMVDIPPERFVDLQTLQRRVRSLVVRARSLPAPYPEQYVDPALDLQNRVVAHAAGLAHDPELIASLLRSANAMDQAFTQINARFRIFELGMAGAAQEPVHQARQSGEKEGEWYVYGTVEADSNLQIAEHYRPAEAGADPFGRMRHVWDEERRGEIIVGWKVLVYWGNSGEWWNPDHSANIGGSHFHMKCESSWARGFSYRVWFYTVPRDLYQFTFRAVGTTDAQERAHLLPGEVSSGPAQAGVSVQ